MSAPATPPVGGTMSHQTLYEGAHEGYSAAARALMDEAEAVITPLFARAVAMGFSYREVAHLLHNVLFDIELHEAVTRLFARENLHNTPPHA